MTTRPTPLCRSWLFAPGAERDALYAAPASGADVIIQELEDFTPPDRRPEAHALAPALYDHWRARGAVAAAWTAAAPSPSAMSASPAKTGVEGRRLLTRTAPCRAPRACRA